MIRSLLICLFLATALPGYCQSFQASADETYQGEWMDARPNGFGISHFANGFTYIGQFENGRRHGYGLMKLPDGGIFIGSFERDQILGVGAYWDHAGHLKGTGYWDNQELTRTEDSYFLPISLILLFICGAVAYGWMRLPYSAVRADKIVFAKADPTQKTFRQSKLRARRINAAYARHEARRPSRAS